MSNAAPSWVVALSETTLGEEEARAAADVVRSGWLTQGERVGAFERAFAERVGVAHAVAVANCTVGLELAYDAAGVGPGDEVMVPALTFVATANAARRRGAVPVFVDVVGDDDLSMDPRDVQRKLTKKTRAIVPVHYAGYAADMRALSEIADEAGVALVEDCAHAPGAVEEPAHVRARPALGGEARACGALGKLGVFSFFSNKNMTTGEGGMITARDEATAVRLRALRSHGMTTGTWDRHRGHAYTYDVVEVGTNARMDEIRAAIGRVQLGRLDAGNATRRAMVRAYRARLEGVPGLQIPFVSRDLAASAHHLFVVLLPEGADRLAVMTAMRARGIQSSIHYPPTDGFRAYMPMTETRAPLPVTHRVAPRILTLPLFATMTEAQVSLVCDALLAALA